MGRVDFTKYLLSCSLCV